MTSTGKVREWHDDHGWGVIDSPETPGGCWAHSSAVLVAGYKTLAPGVEVGPPFSTLTITPRFDDSEPG